MVDIKVPTVGESISEVTLLKWLKKDGEYVDRDEVIAELESEKATFEVKAEQSGVIRTIAKEGDTLTIGAVLANIDEKANQPSAQVVQPEQKATQPVRSSLSKPETITVELPEEKAALTEKVFEAKETVKTGKGIIEL